MADSTIPPRPPFFDRVTEQQLHALYGKVHEFIEALTAADVEDLLAGRKRVALTDPTGGRGC